MPLLTDTAAAPQGLTPQRDVPAPAPTPDFFGETLPAAFQMGNTVRSVADWAADRIRPSTIYDLPADPDYDPFADLKGYEAWAGNFVGAQSREDVHRIKARIDAETEARQTLDAAGAGGVVAALGAGILDPVNLIPVGGSALRSGGLGLSMARGAGEAAKAGLVASVAFEALLQGTHETHTTGESIAGVATATVLSGILGGAAPLLRAGINRMTGRPGAASLDELAARIDGEGRPPAPANDAGGAVPPGAEPIPSAAGGSAGAKLANDTSLEQETLKSALGLERAASFQDPVLRTANSPSVETRRIADALAEQPLKREKHAEGIASPVAAETRIKMWDGPLSQAAEGVDDLFLRYRLGRSGRMGDMLKVGLGDLVGAKPAGALDVKAFRQEIGKAMRRGDAHEIPEVAQAAKQLRETLFDPLKNRAIELGLLPEGVMPETAVSYLTRVYDLGKIIAKRPEFEGRLTDWLSEARRSAGQTIRDTEERIATLGAKAQRLDDELSLLDGRRLGPEEVGSIQAAERAWKDGRVATIATERDLMAARREASRASREHAQAKARLDEFSPTAPLTGGDPLVKVLRDIRQGVKEPQTLSGWLRKQGGIKDEGGELAAMDAAKAKRGLVNNNTGMNLDDAAHAAWEAGYFSSHGDVRPTIDDFLWALRDDLNGTSPRYRDDDLERVAYRDYLHEFSGELDRLGVDVHKMRPEEVRARLDAAEAGGDVRYREATPAAKAKAREIAYYTRRAEARTAQAAERHGAAETAHREAKAARDAARAEFHGMKAKRDSLDRDHRAARAEQQRAERLQADNHGLAGAEDVELQDIARQITDTLLSLPGGRLAYEPVPLVRGPLKERTLSIPDHRIEDFLDSDALTVARIYRRTMGADVELTAAFGRADMQSQFEKIAEDYARLRQGVTDEAELTRLDEAMRADIRDLSAMRDRVRGTYGMPDNPHGLIVRSAKVARTINYWRLLGGMTISAIPDLARPVMVHGVMRVVGDGLAPMIANLKGFRAAAEEVKLAGTALDLVLDTRVAQMADIVDDYGRLSKFERGLQAATEKFGLVSLMAPWNAAMKQFSGVITQTRLLQAIKGYGELRPGSRELERLAWLGIDENGAQRIAAQFSQHGKVEEGVWWANTAAWTDGEAVNAFRAAIVKEVDKTIVTPGQDKPLWMSTELGKLVGQFKTFSLVSTQRVALAALQDRDAATLNGALLGVGLGMAAYTVHAAVSGRDLSDDPKRWAVEGIERSGMLAWLPEVVNTGGKMVGLAGSSKYQSRSATEALLGPTLGSGLDTTLRVTSAAGRGDWAAGDTAALRRLVPMQNLFYLRRLFDQAEAGINETLGVPPTQARGAK